MACRSCYANSVPVARPVPMNTYLSMPAYQISGLGTLAETLGSIPTWAWVLGGLAAGAGLYYYMSK